ncbi:MAG TPA: 50S ribosomal protein L13 [Candidatus Paceibacterota bacterium]|nr:50S ribosomal protein L13 [Candidatus Paceibacterota bacterium]
MTDQKTYAIDAAGKSLGRVASEAAKALMGKTSASYTPHIRSDVKVSINNVSKLHITEKKRLGKIYSTYSGYPGGLKHETLSNLSVRKGTGEALRRAVRNMLPRNTMLVARMKNLQITE